MENKKERLDFSCQWKRRKSGTEAVSYDGDEDERRVPDAQSRRGRENWLT